MVSIYDYPKVIIFLVSCCLFSNSITAQNPKWISYAAKFKDAEGVIDLNLELKDKVSMSMLPFLVMTAAKMNLDTKDGQPSENEMPILLAFSDSVKSVLKEGGSYSYAGNFTRDGVRINYFYVTDTIGLRQKFTIMYAQYFPTYNLGLKFKYEQKWQTYFEFLYPGDERIEIVLKARKGKDKNENKQ